MPNLDVSRELKKLGLVPTIWTARFGLFGFFVVVVFLSVFFVLFCFFNLFYVMYDVIVQRAVLILRADRNTQFINC